MKKYMIIIGMEIQAYNETGIKIMKLTLREQDNVKIKPDTNSIGGLINFGKQIAKGAVLEEYKSNVYVSCFECYPWKEKGYKIGRHVTLELIPDDTTGGIDADSA